MTGLPLASGPVPVAVLLLGALALAWLAGTVVRRSPRSAALTALAALVLTGLLHLLAEHLLFWWNASFPRWLYAYAFAGIWAVLLVLPLFRAASGRVARAAAAPAAAVVLLAVMSGANYAYGQYPTVDSLLDPPRPDAEELPRRAPPTAPGPPTTDATWQPPADMPARGRVFEAPIGESGSGYRSDSAWIWLPPAYLADPPAVDLPVLVLLHGQPGGPSDWFVSGRISEALDEFAARHRGLAPVVVAPDLSGGGARRWPLCLDSDVGSAATYLAVDLPRWVRENLASGLGGPRQWAVAGYSYGGTCALQLAAGFPQAYPTFIDVAGAAGPMVPSGRRQELLEEYFNGDAAALARQEPLELLRSRDLAGSAGIVVIGAGDGFYAPAGRRVYDAARAAGAHMQLQELPGGHSWQVWRAGVVDNLDWLGGRLGLTTP
ncbi:enterobactin/ferric enterobactin esterase [Arthrobacter saudimassiliensis]|uniref:Enterobactin/ferric enterobactin esterase n=1 Tax=Arthrobacter saudimassiliensis TaxID=1461584 RepID=A0A078MII8_9MICC|nr:enterobactin/ferric enterobactin esterase [Arthrobacter saudimassiliensis]